MPALGVHAIADFFGLCRVPVAILAAGFSGAVTDLRPTRHCNCMRRGSSGWI